MKLFNKSKLSDIVLEPLLTAAGRAVGARTTGVVVKVTQGCNRGVSGIAYQCYEVYKWHLWKGGSRKKGIKTDGGYFQLTIPRPAKGWDCLGLAQQVFEVAAHEWVHIRDYQHGGRWAMPFASRGNGGRRSIHDRRPEELRAINTVDEALNRGAVERNQDLIINLAIAMEMVAGSR
jgi:hypothetical protein